MSLTGIPQDNLSSKAAMQKDSQQRNLIGKYMTFKLAKEEYGVPILSVREIIRYMEITRVPGVARSIRGVINLRGKVIPVVDVRLQFGLTPIEPTERTVIIVVQCVFHDRELTLGLLVDEVLEVMAFSPDQFESTPDFGGDLAASKFLFGVGKAGHRVVFLLDIDRLLTVEQKGQIADAEVEI